eukprot:Gregarina_sp_Poly_1__500@NODE_111_length_13906_cov_58_362887_g98_i0_p6_GENE_NODE_111_length_13906_cov_58_362887_g98_i0NODE_111_length_13906_cov_58_362887_g98_i0_p6_ORF_typecomplete_len199_score32_93Ku/PF02735_16/4_9e19Ku_C/PF03730_14/1_4e10_NODE_111_length_13906_cov_58_362887_g98_i054106006
MPSDSRLMLMGFKPLRALDRRRLSYKMQVYYGFPIDAEIDGSGVIFRSLIESMAELGKVAIFAWQFRNTSNFNLVAGIPHIADDMESNAGGMFLIPIPYSDDIRDVRVMASEDISAEIIDQEEQNIGDSAFSDLLESLDLGDDFNIGDIPNPALLRHYQGLEALALGSTEIGPLDDKTLPNAELFGKVSNVLEDLQNR